MDGKEQRVGIPESITINGVTYLVKETPELQKFIQEVAKVEKSKLYTQYENLKAQIANLGKVQVTNGGDFDINAIVEKLKGTFVTKEDFQSTLPGIIKEVVQPVLTATEQNRKDELTAYREKLINENLATCIPELVKGETKEELDKSLQESIRLRASYPTPSTAAIADKPVKDPLIQKQMMEQFGGERPQITPTPRDGAPAQKPATAPMPTPPAAPRRPSPEANDNSTNIKKMSMGEFAKQREALKAQLESMYGGGSF